MHEGEKKKEIQNLLLVFGAAIGSALFGILYIIYSSSGTGHYTLSNILLSPEVIQHFSSLTEKERSKHISPLQFNRIDLSFFNPETHLWQTKEISTEDYQKIYTLIASDKSIESPSDAVINAFREPPPVKLIIQIEEKSAKNFTSVKSVFQEVDFAARGDFFRVQLREQGQEAQQAYFYHRAIYPTVIKMLAGQHD
ncbi:MAG: hypothetical protein CK425_08135 [Parachlamydia sp.]|nr:MAG: hypothetical protein CK425_08135 [Parachlamydia sp.]